MSSDNEEEKSVQGKDEPKNGRTEKNIIVGENREKGFAFVLVHPYLIFISNIGVDDDMLIFNLGQTPDRNTGIKLAISFDAPPMLRALFGDVAAEIKVRLYKSVGGVATIGKRYFRVAGDGAILYNTSLGGNPTYPWEEGTHFVLVNFKDRRVVMNAFYLERRVFNSQPFRPQGTAPPQTISLQNQVNAPVMRGGIQQRGFNARGRGGRGFRGSSQPRGGAPTQNQSTPSFGGGFGGIAPPINQSSGTTGGGSVAQGGGSQARGQSVQENY